MATASAEMTQPRTCLVVWMLYDCGRRGYMGNRELVGAKRLLPVALWCTQDDIQECLKALSLKPISERKVMYPFN